MQAEKSGSIYLRYYDVTKVAYDNMTPADLRIYLHLQCLIN